MGLSSPPSSSAQKHSLYWYLSLMKKPRKKNTKNCAGFECSSYSNECVWFAALYFWHQKQYWTYWTHLGFLHSTHPKTHQLKSSNHCNDPVHFFAVCSANRSWCERWSHLCQSHRLLSRGDNCGSLICEDINRKMEKTSWINLDQVPSLKLT